MQEGHEKLRQIMLRGSTAVMAGGELRVLDEIRADPFFAVVKDRLTELVDAKKCIGLCEVDVCFLGLARVSARILAIKG